MFLPFYKRVLKVHSKGVLVKGSEYHQTQQQKLHQHKFILPCPGLIHVVLNDKR